MKAIFSMLFTLFIMTSCENLTHEHKLKILSTEIFGKWELSDIILNAVTDSICKAGNGNIYQFNKDSTYQAYRNGKLFSQGKFHIERYKIPGQDSLENIFWGKEKIPWSFELRDNKLYMGTIAPDAELCTYKKISD